MTFTEAIKICLRKYVTFSGRASRSEYWWFFLFCFLGSLVASFLEQLINGLTGTKDGPTLLSGAFNLATIIPSFSAGWRRMHDTGRSGLYLLYPFLVMIGIGTFLALFAESNTFAPGSLSGPVAIITALAAIVLLISPFLVIWWLTRPSQPGPNAYGPNPHEVTP